MRPRWCGFCECRVSVCSDAVATRSLFAQLVVFDSAFRTDSIR